MLSHLSGILRVAKIRPTLCLDSQERFLWSLMESSEFPIHLRAFWKEKNQATIRYVINTSFANGSGSRFSLSHFGFKKTIFNICLTYRSNSLPFCLKSFFEIFPQLTKALLFSLKWYLQLFQSSDICQQNFNKKRLLKIFFRAWIDFMNQSMQNSIRLLFLSHKLSNLIA